jgi:hypothetical protein
LGIKRKTGIHIAFVCHECPKAFHISKTSSREQKMGNKLFFKNKKVSKSPQLSAEDVKVHFEQRFRLCKETSALVNLLFISMNGKSC